MHSLIPHPVASEHRWLVKSPRWIHSVPDVSGRRSWRCGCHARLWKRVPFVNIAFLRCRSIKRRQWKRKLDYHGVVFAHLATGLGIKAKDPSGLDSDWWIPHSRCSENPARAKALAGFSRHLSAGFTDPNPALGVFRYIIHSFIHSFIISFFLYLFPLSLPLSPYPSPPLYLCLYLSLSLYIYICISPYIYIYVGTISQ